MPAGLRQEGPFACRAEELPWGGPQLLITNNMARSFKQRDFLQRLNIGLAVVVLPSRGGELDKLSRQVVSRAQACGHSLGIPMHNVHDLYLSTLSFVGSSAPHKGLESSNQCQQGSCTHDACTADWTNKDVTGAQRSRPEHKAQRYISTSPAANVMHALLVCLPVCKSAPP